MCVFDTSIDIKSKFCLTAYGTRSSCNVYICVIEQSEMQQACC